MTCTVESSLQLRQERQKSSFKMQNIDEIVVQKGTEDTPFDTKYRLFLSEKDEYVPDTHIGMYSLFRNPDNTSVYMSESLCQSIRYKTYAETLELFKKYESPDYRLFFTYNAEALTKLGKNYFATHNKLAPIAELIECFTKPIKVKEVWAYAVSYGLDKTVLKAYLDSLRKGEDFWEAPPISVMKRKKVEAEKRDFVLFDEDEVQMDYWNSIHMPRNPLYHRFLDWCKLQNLHPHEGMLMAIDCMLNALPPSDLAQLTEYDKLGELDVPIYAKPRDHSNVVRRNVVFSGKLYSIADAIIQRYNREPKNISKKIDFDLYCNNALHMLNQSMDVYYRDPELYEEQVALQEAEEYNKRLFGSIEKPKLPEKVEQALKPKQETKKRRRGRNNGIKNT